MSGKSADGILAEYLPDILTKKIAACILNKLKYLNNDPVIKFPHSRGVSGALYLQSAIAGVMLCLGCLIVELPLISGVEVWVLRNRNL